LSSITGKIKDVKHISKNISKDYLLTTHNKKTNKEK
jgi:hypothetical protein